MTLRPGLRGLALTAHITAPVGWLGAVASFLAHALVGLTRPLAFASLLTGLVVSLGTTWGLFRHYWVVTKLAITLLATLQLLLLNAPYRDPGTRGLRGRVVERRSPPLADPSRGRTPASPCSRCSWPTSWACTSRGA